MTVKAIVIKPEGIEIKQVNPDLESIRAEIGGGWIENVAINEDRTHMYIDEEGKFKNLPFNPIASVLVWAIADFRIARTDFIAGTAIVFGADGPEEADVNDRVIGQVQLAKTIVETQ